MSELDITDEMVRVALETYWERSTANEPHGRMRAALASVMRLGDELSNPDLSRLSWREKRLFSLLCSAHGDGITIRGLSKKSGEPPTQVVALLSRLYDKRLVEGVFCDKTHHALWRPLRAVDGVEATHPPENQERAS